jgi:hypothetical protein
MRGQVARAFFLTYSIKIENFPPLIPEQTYSFIKRRLQRPATSLRFATFCFRLLLLKHSGQSGHTLSPEPIEIKIPVGIVLTLSIGWPVCLTMMERINSSSRMTSLPL